MFGITYDNWKNTCEMYFDLGTDSKKAYLQWFPFYKLSKENEDMIKSEAFYTKFIESGCFVFYPSAMHHSENFIQKNDGSFREAVLVSPIMYLVLQCIGREIFHRYTEKRPRNISAFYAGAYNENRPKYKRSYDDFFKYLNLRMEKYDYFIKTDITDFFSNINVDLLINRIDKVCNETKVTISQPKLQLYKELLLYCGDGRFPLIENSMASSYLATVVYLDEVDCRLYEFISQKVTEVTSFEMVRYVDDLYILFSSKTPLKRLNKDYNLIRNQYSSILKEYGLALNIKKCCIRPSREINEELKKSMYDEAFNGRQHDIEEHFSGTLKPFLETVYNRLKKDGIDSAEFEQLIDDHFCSQDIEFTPSEVFNYLVYENTQELQNASDVLVKIINRDISFLSVDPKRLSVMVMKSGSDQTIKAMLNQLFNHDRADMWNSYDTTVAIAYLIQSEFRHIDLLEVLKRRSPGLYDYYQENCGKSFINFSMAEESCCLHRCAEKDTKAVFLYLMYLAEKNRHNDLSAYAYFKNFFDRISADMAFIAGIGNDKKPNYKLYYTEKIFIKMYSGISNSEEVIKKAHKLRNENPLAHSSGKLIDSSNSSKEIELSISELKCLIQEFAKRNGL